MLSLTASVVLIGEGVGLLQRYSVDVSFGKGDFVIALALVQPVARCCSTTPS